MENRTHHGGMFIRSYVEVALPFAEVEATLLRMPGRWLSAAAIDADEWGASLLSKIGVGSRGAGLSRQVELHVDRPIRSPGKVLLPIRWHAVKARGLFPVMEAELVLTALGPDITQLALEGRYDPPFGVAGKIADRAVMHRVAEATVRGFVTRVAARLEGAANPALTR